MKVILLENVKKLGKKYEVVDVADGYARNFLLKENKAEKATEKKLKELDKRKAEEQKRMQKNKEETEKIIKELEDKEFKIKMKAGEKGQLFESVDAKKISEKLEKEGFSISESNIKLEDPIKEITEIEIPIDLDHDLSTKIKIKIEKE